MRKLRELTTRWSLAELVEVVSKSLEGSNHSTIEPGETAPPVKPEGEKKFVKLHKTEKHTNPDRLGNPSFSGKVKKDTSKAGKEPLPGFPPDTGEPYWPPVKESWGVDEHGRFRRLDEQGTHALQKGENPWKVWKQTRGESGLSWGKFKSAQTDKKVVGNKSSRRLQPGQEIQTGVKAAESPKAPAFQKTEKTPELKAQRPETHGATGALQPSVSPKAPQWSPTAKPYEHTPVTPEIKAKQIQSPINKEPMNRIPGTTAPPSAMDRVKAVTGRATPTATSGSAAPSSTKTSATTGGASGRGISGAATAATVAGTVGKALTPGGSLTGTAADLGRKAAPVVQPAVKAAGTAGSALTGGATALGAKVGSQVRSAIGSGTSASGTAGPAIQAAGTVGKAVTPGGSLTGAAAEIGKAVPPSIAKPTAQVGGTVGQILGGGAASIAQRAGQAVRRAVGKAFPREETEQLMNQRAAIMSSLIRGLEPALNEAAGIAKMIAPKVNPLIKRPKFDAHGNIVLTKDAKANITQGKKPRKLTGITYKPSAQKRFGEAKEIEEGNTPADQGIKAAKRDDEERKKSTVLVSPKGYKGGGKVSRIPKSQYNPKKHSLAEEQLDEKNWIQNAIKKPGALTAAAHRAKQSVGEFAREHKHSSGKVGKRARLALTLKKINKEETEQLDELKKATLARYTKSAATDLKYKSMEYGHDPIAKRARIASRDVTNREKGIGRAADRLGGTYETGKPLKFKIPGDESNKTYTQKRKKLYHGEETEIDEGLRPKIKVSGDRSVDKNVQIGKKTYHVSGFKSTKTAEDEAKKGWEKTASKSGKWRAKTFGTKFVHGEETQLDEEADLRRAPRKLAPQEWRIGCMSDFEEKKSVQLIEEGKKLDESGPTKKHFQMAADAIRAIPDENKRKEHAAAHADLYSKQNPRFNREKFYPATGLKKHQYGPNEETELDEVITKKTSVGAVIHDFVHSDDPRFKGDSKKQRIKRALGAYYKKQRGG